MEEGHRTISRLDPMHTIAKTILSIIISSESNIHIAEIDYDPLVSVLYFPFGISLTCLEVWTVRNGMGMVCGG